MRTQICQAMPATLWEGLNPERLSEGCKKFLNKSETYLLLSAAELRALLPHVSLVLVWRRGKMQISHRG
jgi:hypothetical protein